MVRMVTVPLLNELGSLEIIPALALNSATGYRTEAR